MLVWMGNFLASNWNQCIFTKGINFNKLMSSSKKLFAEKFLISSPDKLADLISGSISQQWLGLSSLNCSGTSLCYIPHKHTKAHWNHRCEPSPAEMFIPISACKPESKLASETFELCLKLHLYFWELINMGCDLWHCGFRRVVVNEWGVSPAAVHCCEGFFEKVFYPKVYLPTITGHFCSQMHETWDRIWPGIKLGDT